VLPSAPVASKSAYQSSEPGAEILEMLDLLDTALDRLKVMYEQYFLGIAKVAPSHLHTDAERKLREIAQINIRNTALRYRFATLQQKYGSYNSYWRRTLRQIEQGTYVRSLSKVKRKYEGAGGEIPEEILAAMPKRMREQVARDREVAAAAAVRRGQIKESELPGGANFKLPELVQPDDDDDVAQISSPLPPELSPAHRVSTKEMQQDDLQQMLSDMAAPDVARPPTGVIPKLPRIASDDDDEQTQPGVAPPRPPASRESRPSIQAATLPSLGPPPRTPGTQAPRAGTVPGPPRIPPPPPRPQPPPPPPRAATAPAARANNPRPDPLPPGMTEADVRTLYQKYARARELVGERNDDSTYQALLRTLHTQAPKIMAAYNAKGVEFGVVIKDKQVVLKAKPK
jgi:hypothetical protein